ncbi:MAG: DNA-3-methyladenine glycosylase I [Rhodospirillaceae bacterium]|nr:DNA-3-methyladenine glycosylase I [Rhodospirillaceae bacterium]MBT4488707.1 DNA-3-methyladenine glycosylase I [Rhodospirillaceae bacterium]MBT5195226.1 DNA-3-methyladenine glycosylase I [Rhodospirillaceae bacterium]MBT5897683.1 DNA-3-methyladenine glycosylase I [Rhodospirillaceae bacterium]MBT6427807.1 DNA-3-methyladenine glycosylase I [Rhodospirillaceae bacterium]
MTIRHADGLIRCAWCGDSDPVYIAYHDEEWGVPEWDDQALFEKLILDGFQAGLSWITILRKRDNFRAAFDGFDPAVIATYDDAKVEALMADAGIVRNRAKIMGTIAGAKLWLEIMGAGKGAFADYLWSFVDGKPVVTAAHGMGELLTQDASSQAMSKDLKARGFKFCGPTICYAFMEAVGMINDHVVDCHRHSQV